MADQPTTEPWSIAGRTGERPYWRRMQRLLGWGKRNGLMAFIDQAIVSGSNFFTALILARFLVPADYGLYVLIVALILFINGIQSALITSPLMVIAQRYSAEQRAAYYNHLSVLQCVGCVLAALVIAALMALGQYWQLAIIPALSPVVVMIVTATYLVQEFLRRALFARHSEWSGLLVDLISYGTQIIAILGLIIFGSLTLERTLWAIGLTSLAGCVFGLIKLHISLRAISPATLAATWEQHWDQGRWLTGSMVTQWISGQFYFFVVAALLSPAATGALAASRNLLGFAHIFLLSLENFVPSLATQRLLSGGLPAMTRWIGRFRLALATTMGLYCLGVAIFAEPLMTLLFGAQYSGTGMVVALLAVVNFLVALNRPSMFGLRALDQSRWIFYSHLISSVVTLVISVPLVEAAGLLGAAVGFVITQVLVLSIASVAYRREVQLRVTNNEAAGQGHIV